ncbi:MAG: DUF4032 domain-containing protein, partial [Propionibacteriaceae bacterium]|nr:DUF4032 domain-containing protein [Propionibacteriaceae bacterium]
DWLTKSFEPVVTAVPQELRGKREPAQIFHEVLDYRWYQAQRESRDVPLVEATHGYVHDVLSGLPDEAMNPDILVPVVPDRPLANPYDPTLGYADDDEIDRPHDPWEDGPIDVPAQPYILDSTVLRQAQGPAAETSPPEPDCPES